jgi:pimeloyl-ACP methyl ester carboxylesterase
MENVSRDGVALAYTEQGQGNPPMVFVHGWSCDHRYFAPQVDHFSRGHRTIAVDLRGHGASDAPQQEYTMSGFADDVAWLCRELRVEKPVVVGHSMGAVIALQLAAQHPDVPSAIVMIDGGTRTMVPPPPGGDPLLPLAEVMRHADDLSPVRDVIDTMFLPTDDPERRAWITEVMLASPRHVIASAWEQLRKVDGASAARACKVPVLYVNASIWRPEFELFKALCPQLMLGQTVGAGHFNMLEVPDQVNAMLSRFLTLNRLS